MDRKLYKAAAEGHPSLLREQIQSFDLLEQVSLTKQNTVLHLVASSATVPLLRLIKEKCPQLIGKQNLNGDTALHIAARAGKIDLVKFLIDWAESEEEQRDVYVFLRKQNKEGNTPLLEAVRGKHVDLTLMLLDKDPQSACIVNGRGESPLYIAAGLLKGTKVVEKIMGIVPQEDMDEGMLFGGPNGHTPLHAAVASRWPGKDSVGNVMLLMRLKNELISKGDDDGRTPLHHAVSINRHEYAYFLLDANIFSACQNDKEGLYPIHLAAREGNSDMIELLLQYCPESRELLNKEGQNALHVAAMKGRENVVTYMLEKPMLEMLINEKDKKGNTPLHAATVHCHPKIVSILTADKRVDMNAKNNEGLTALDIAEMNTDEPISLPKLLTLLAFRIAGATLRPGGLVNEKTMHTETLKPELYKERFSTLVLVATLIATVTFTAGFTIPGGNFNDGDAEGTAISLKKTAFQVFVICNTVAMYLSIIVVVNHIAAQLADSRLLILGLNVSLVQLGIALIMMSIAFAAGLFLVIVRLLWLALVVLFISCIFLLYILAVLILFKVPAWSKYRFLRFMSKCGFHLLIFIFGKFLNTSTGQ